MGENCCCSPIYSYSFYWRGSYRGEIFTDNQPLHDVLAKHIQNEGDVCEGPWIVVRECGDSNEHVAATFNVERSDKFTITAT